MTDMALEDLIAEQLEAISRLTHAVEENTKQHAHFARVAEKARRASEASPAERWADIIVERDTTGSAVPTTSTDDTDGPYFYFELTPCQADALVESFLATDDEEALQLERQQFLKELVAQFRVESHADIRTDLDRGIFGSFLVNWAPGRDNLDFHVVFPDGLPETPSTPPQV
ncbi:hypothetical protein GQE99_10285 [Maritimibacter sp. DP07]|uniref:Uncharacterized protein n=1 Tax=Maritimibacter harenae TaxID=2606218 RepID=A0A845M985_9RHOB|nr:hypothetical protein [Maritimibacter harenae]MZR13404.1 hypothetical protein [Maritimibacter harenae]